MALADVGHRATRRAIWCRVRPETGSSMREAARGMRHAGCGMWGAAGAAQASPQRTAIHTITNSHTITPTIAR